MPELTREEKLKLIEKLPQQLQDFLYSEDFGAFLFYLESKYNLAEDKVAALAKIIVDVVLGITTITSLAQEINSKIVTDTQAAMNLAQELNTELLAPAMTAPATQVAPSAKFQIPSTDRYREPTTEIPEVVDLRNQPKMEKPVAPMPSAPTPQLQPKVPVRPTEPIKPAPQPPLIEAEPHKTPDPVGKPLVSAPKPIDTYREPIETPKSPPTPAAPAPTPETSGTKPQYIMRPTGAAPTEKPDNVLDLRKDKGEF